MSMTTASTKWQTTGWRTPDRFRYRSAIYQPASTDEYAKIDERERRAAPLHHGRLLQGDATIPPIANPGVKFAIVDMTWETYPITCANFFASEEVGYLAGTLVALMSTSKVIGAIGVSNPAGGCIHGLFQYGAQ